MSVSVAVVGATGLVGREVLTILEERLFEVTEVHALASRQSIGREVSFGDRTLKVKDLEAFDFSSVDVVFLCAGGDVSRKNARKIAATGALVIDNSSALRMAEDVPLIVPEVNSDAIEGARQSRLIANPNCSTAQLVVALKPIHDRYRIKRVVVATYQSVSGAGNAAMDELWRQTRGVYVNDAVEREEFPKQIAFNLIPVIGDFMDGGDTGEEWKMMVETKKILDPKIKLTATCVRVPVFVGHSEAVNVETHEPIEASDVRDLLRESPGLMVIDKPDEDDGFITPVEVVGEFATYVSRIRTDCTVENGINFWCVSDNLRKGAALNAVQIAELARDKGFFQS
jgi:aspartate-semialdehyde dehydrogenase